MSNLTTKSRQIAAHRMIQRWGGIGYILRGATRHACTMARVEYKPTERGLYVDGSSRIRISMIGIPFVPDFEQDQLLFKTEQYRILLPVEGPRPENDFVYVDCNVVYVAKDDTAS